MQQSQSIKSGKWRRIRYRLHPAAANSNELVSEVKDLHIFFTQESEPVKSNIFENVVIPQGALKQNLPSYSKRDKNNLELNAVIKRSAIKNVGCARRRKIPFHEVVASAQDFLKKRETEKKKAKPGILGNFQALKEALPALDQLMVKQKKEDNKPRVAKNFAKQDAEMMEDLQTYQQVLNNTEYTADPIGTITSQLRQRLQSGCL